MTAPIIWQTTRSICQGCGGLTEEGELSGRVVSERCPRCKWEIAAPDWKPRLFGSSQYKLANEMENIQ